MTSTVLTRNHIRDLNDAFRTQGRGAGQWLLTRGVADKGATFVYLATAAVRSFDGFTPGDDPYGEHDFGSFNLGGETLFFKIDYYDTAMEAGSDDPSDPAVTRRALTIMLASEY